MDTNYIIKVEDQLYERAIKLSKHCPNIQRAWFFGVVDLDAEQGEKLKMKGWTPLYSSGEVYYREVKTRPSDPESMIGQYFLMSYKTMIGDAVARNETFLNILKKQVRKVIMEESP